MRVAQLRQVIDGFRDAEVRDVVGRGLRAQQQMIAHVLFDRAVAVVAADDRIGQVEIFDHGFELAAMPLGHLAAKDGGEFRGLANRAIGIEEPLAERVQRRPALKDQVVAVLDLREETADADSRRPAVRSA